MLIASAACAGPWSDPDAQPTGARGSPLVVEVPVPPEAGPVPGGHFAPHPRHLAFFDVEIGDEVGSVSERLGRSPTRLSRSAFEAVYAAASYRDLGADIGLALGFDEVAIFTDAEGALFRAYVAADRVRMMSFVGSTMQGHRGEGRLSSACRIDQAFDAIESVCGTGYAALESVDSRYPTSFHYFTRGFSVVVGSNADMGASASERSSNDPRVGASGVDLKPRLTSRITELHVYGGLTRDEISRVEAALRADPR